MNYEEKSLISQSLERFEIIGLFKPNDTSNYPTIMLIGQFLFGLFLRQTNFGSACGVAGYFVILITLMVLPTFHSRL